MAGRDILIRFLSDVSNLKSGTQTATSELGNIETKAQSSGSKIGDLIAKIPGIGPAFSGVRGSVEGVGTAAEGAGGNMLGIAAASATAGVAVGAFALKAVGQYEDLALKAGEVATATGLTVDQASRWIEVAKDHGLATDAVETAMGRLNKTAELTPGKIDAAGASIVRNKDGTLDAQATFLSVTDALGKIPDAGQRAADGAAIFGKGWQGMSALIGEGAPKLKSDLESVQASKVFGANDVDTAKKVREGFDSIKDAGEGLMLTIGKALAPVVAELAPLLGNIIAEATPLVSLIGESLASAFKALEPVIKLVSLAMPILTKAVELALLPMKLMNDAVTGIVDAFTSVDEPQGKLSQSFIDGAPAARAMNDALHETHATMSDYAQASIHADDATADLKLSQADAAETAKLQEASNKTLNDTLNRQIGLLGDDLSAQQALSDAMRAAADATFDVDSKTVALNDQLAGLDQALKDAGDDADKHKVALDGVKQSAGDLADAQVHLREEQDKANGITTSAATKQDTWNAAMINASATAKGPARQAIIDYIAQANQIPTEKATAIQAAVDAGDLATANQLLTDASKARTVSVKVDTDNASIADANRKIQQGINKDIILGVRAGTTGQAGTAHAAGGQVESNEDWQIAGESGREAFKLPTGTQFKTASQTARDAKAATGSGATIINVTIYGNITDGVQAQLDAWGRDLAAQINAGRRP